MEATIISEMVTPIRLELQASHVLNYLNEWSISKTAFYKPFS